jgi:phosphatidate cytidylyltransferase
VLKDRLRTSAILIAIVAALLYLDANHSRPGAEGLWLVPLLGFFALGTAFDMVGLLLSNGRAIDRRTAMIAAALVSASSCVPLVMEFFGSAYPTNCPVGRLGWIPIAAALAIFLILGREMYLYDGSPSDGLERVSHGTLVAIYVGLPMAMFVALRDLGQANWGLAALLTTVAVTKSADAGAYFTGKSIGRNKLIPRLSPGKTWEGAIGGIVTSTIVAFVCLKWLFPAIAGTDAPPMPEPSIAWLSTPLWGALVLGPLLALSGMVGDLAESFIKRECQAKDSGNWLPGLGGVWDVTDSLIAAVVPAFLGFAAGIAG